MQSGIGRGEEQMPDAVITNHNGQWLVTQLVEETVKDNQENRKKR